jgi:hypothetical protein
MPMLYAPGTTPVAVTPRGFAVFEHGASAALLARVRSVVADGRGLGGVIESLTGAYGASLTAIPAFAVALVEGDALRIAVRGDFVFDVDADVPEQVSGAGVTTWTERVVRGVRRVTLQSGVGEGADPAELPVADGVVLASTIVWDATTAPAPAAAAAPPAAQPVRAPHPVSAPQPVWAAPAPVTAQQPAAATDATPHPVAAPKADVPASAAAEGQAPPASAPRVAVPQPEPRPLGQVPGLIDSSTVHTVAGDETLLPEDSELSQSRPEATGAEDVSSTVGSDPLWGATVIRPVDGAAGAPAAPAPGDHDGATISLAQARALRAGRAAAEQAPSSTTPPLAPPRPPAPGRIRVSTGQVLLLDRTVVIGRRPRSTRVSGTDLPHLVAVDSPQQDISRSHVELRVEGESIVATDLRTTNGTTLLRAGSDPVRLHPGEATVVIAGDVLDLGDGITVAIEGLA